MIRVIVQFRVIRPFQPARPRNPQTRAPKLVNNLFLLILLPLVLAACQPSPPATRASRDTRAAPDTTAIRRDVEHLASAALEGRGTGTAGNDSAAAYIARRFESLHLAALPHGCRSPAGTL